ncbi:hypothetical protein EW146_g3478 [Bondarzewia mesenterica]|uniref:Uncharacterized protein n=1 Tax=Bondarzewia mesenterica TaxID=1095465 RepID=A0A4S4LXP9_9AGAM|nr:hypothetical protein EW146_g3478 [Bondarzewia mesenterica]
MDPNIDVCMLLGYPADEIWLLETAQVRQLISQPDPKILAKFDPRVHYQFVQNELWQGVRKAAHEIIAECRIPDLRLRPIWISDARTLMCWSLPAHMWRKRQEPKYWLSTSGDVPMKLRGQTEAPEWLSIMTIGKHPGWVDDYVDIETDEDLDEDSYEDSDEDSKLDNLKVKTQGSRDSS